MWPFYLLYLCFVVLSCPLLSLHYPLFVVCWISNLRTHSCIRNGTDPYRSCACFFSLREFIWALLKFSWRAFFFFSCFPPFPLALTFFLPPLPQLCLWPEGRDLREIAQLRMRVPRSISLYIMHNVWLCASVFAPLWTLTVFVFLSLGNLT